MAEKSRLIIDEINDRAVERIVHDSGDYAALLRRRLTEGVAFAQRIAPDGPPVGRGYVAGLGETVVKEGGSRTGYVISTDFKTWWVEKGTHGALGHRGTPAHHVLARTLYHLAD